MDNSSAETVRLDELEILSSGGSECRLPRADDHRVEKAGFVFHVPIEGRVGDVDQVRHTRSDTFQKTHIVTRARTMRRPRG